MSVLLRTFRRQLLNLLLITKRSIRLFVRCRSVDLISGGRNCRSPQTSYHYHYGRQDRNPVISRLPAQETIRHGICTILFRLHTECSAYTIRIFARVGEREHSGYPRWHCRVHIPEAHQSWFLIATGFRRGISSIAVAVRDCGGSKFSKFAGC